MPRFAARECISGSSCRPPLRHSDSRTVTAARLAGHRCPWTTWRPTRSAEWKPLGRAESSGGRRQTPICQRACPPACPPWSEDGGRLASARTRSVDKPLVANGRGPYRRSCPKGLSTPTPDQGAIPGQAETETPSGRKVIADHGPATADDDRDLRQGRQRLPRRNGAVPSDIRFPDRCVPTTRRARHRAPRSTASWPKSSSRPSLREGCLGKPLTGALWGLDAEAGPALAAAHLDLPERLVHRADELAAR